LEPAELQVAVCEGAFDAASHLHLADQAVSLTLAVKVPASSSDEDGGGAAAARLHLRLPPGYPQQQAAQIDAVTCELLGRAGEQECAQRLQQLADEAAASGSDAGGTSLGSTHDGQECLCSLVELLQHELQAAAADTAVAAEAAAAPQPASRSKAAGSQYGAATAAPCAGSAACSAGGRTDNCQLALLRLDHMHARAAYSRTLRRWAGELGLGGRLLFCSGGSSSSNNSEDAARSGGSKRSGGGSSSGSGGSPPGAIIVILLEGPGSTVKEFLVRLRTRNVDVDSKGR